MEYLFVFTFAVCVLFSLSAIALVFGTGVITWPRYMQLRPDGYLVGYPSILYQVYFWFSYAGVI